MIEKYELTNGVRIVSEKMETVRSVAIGIWIKNGSRNESEDVNGISHFLEHMFFKGTTRRSAKDIAESFDRIGGQVNAFTSKEYTCIYTKVLDTHASYALEILADMFFNSTFDEKELVKEKNVVFEEIKMYEDTPDDMVHDLLGKAIFGNHPLGFPILGTEKTLQSFTPSLLHSYKEETYTPENVVISIAGNFSDSLIGEIRDRFGHFRGPGFVKRSEKPSFHKNEIVRKKDTEQAHLCIGFEGVSVNDQKIYPLILANNILGGSMSSRLFQQVREERGLAYSIFSYHTSFEDTGVVTIYGGTGADQLDQLFVTILDTLDVLIDKGVTEQELENSKEQMKGSMVLSLESTNSRMSRNGKNELLLGEHKSMEEIEQIIDAVTVEEVNTLIRELFTRDYSIALIHPEGKLPKRFQ